MQAGTWQGTAIGSQFGGLGANESAASGVLSFNAGAIVNNAITTNGVAFGSAGNTLSFTSAGANAVFLTNGSNVPVLGAVGASLTISASVLNTIQPILTSSTPQFAGLGIGQVAPVVTAVGITGPVMAAQSTGAVASLQSGSTYTKNTTTTLTWSEVLIQPTLNFGASNLNTTLNIFNIDTAAGPVNVNVATTFIQRWGYNQATVATMNTTGSLSINGGLTSLGILTMGSGPTTVTDSTGKILSAALNTVAVGQGGTGATTFTVNGVLYGNTTSAVQVTAQGAANSVLIANAGAPSFSQSPIINTSLQVGLSGQTGSLSFLNTNGFGNIFQAGAMAATRTLVWPTTDPTVGQVLTATAPSGSTITLSWAASGTGSGTVNSGVLGNVPYYTGTGTTIGPMTRVCME